MAISWPSVYACLGPAVSREGVAVECRIQEADHGVTTGAQEYSGHRQACGVQNLESLVYGVRRPLGRVGAVFVDKSAVGATTSASSGVVPTAKPACFRSAA